MEQQVAPQNSSEEPLNIQNARVKEPLNIQEAKPSDPYSQGFNEGIKTLQELKKDVIEQRSLMIVGAAILLVMVATLVVMILLSWMDNVGSLQQQVDRIEFNEQNNTGK